MKWKILGHTGWLALHCTLIVAGSLLTIDLLSELLLPERNIAAAIQSTYYGGSTSGLFLILQSVGATIVWRPIAAARRRWSYHCFDTTIIPVRRSIERIYRLIPTGLAMPPAMRTKRRNIRNTQQLLVYCDHFNNFSSPPLTQYIRLFSNFLYSIINIII